MLGFNIRRWCFILLRLECEVRNLSFKRYLCIEVFYAATTLLFLLELLYDINASCPEFSLLLQLRHAASLLNQFLAHQTLCFFAFRIRQTHTCLCQHLLFILVHVYRVWACRFRLRIRIYFSGLEFAWVIHIVWIFALGHI